MIFQIYHKADLANSNWKKSGRALICAVTFSELTTVVKYHLPKGLVVWLEIISYKIQEKSKMVEKKNTSREESKDYLF